MPPQPFHRRRAFVGTALLATALVGWLAFQSAETPPSPPGAGAAAPVPASKRPPRLAAQAAGPRPESAAQALALEDLLAGRPFTLVADGRPRRFHLSLAELYFPSAAEESRLRQIPPQPDAAALVRLAEAEAGAAWVMYPEGLEGRPEHRHVLTGGLLVQGGDRAAVLASLSSLGLEPAREPSYAPGSFIVQTAGPRATLEALARLTAMPAVAHAGPLLLRKRSPALTPDDPLYAQQWHLKNTGQVGGKAGFDVNLTTVWDTWKGQGIKIAIVDDGLDMLHPDLLPNMAASGHYDWNATPPDTDPSPVAASDNHGTRVAGLAGARGGNTLGISGAAPAASLVGYRLISSLVSDADEADAMARDSATIQIKNNSWGGPDSPDEVYIPGPLFQAAKQSATAGGRQGLGTLFVWSAGNGRDRGDQGNKDGYTNSIHDLPVGALANDGTLSYYSETGAHVVMVAPSSGNTGNVVTTDRRGLFGSNPGFGTSDLADGDYTRRFSGTSAAAPVASGVLALLLESKPTLGWRDVKEILLRSSTKVDAADAGWLSRTGGDDPALPPIKHHVSYGGGLINAQQAVALAANWTPLGPMVEESRSRTASLFIPDNNTTGLPLTFDFSDASPLRVENVSVRVDIDHDYRGDLEISLRSPTGVVSLLAAKEVRDGGVDGYQDHVFTSVRHWGDVAKGVWTLTIKDLAGADTGFFRSATVKLHGSATAPAQVATLTGDPRLLEAGQPCELSGTGTGYGHLAYEWRRGSGGLNTNGSATLTIPSVSTGHAGSYTLTVSNLTGSATSAPIQIGVVRRALVPQTVNEGSTATFTADAAGPGMTYKWYKDGAELSDNRHYTGTTSSILRVQNANLQDEGAYRCLCAFPASGESITTDEASLTLLRKPVITAPALGIGVVSGIVSHTLTAEPAPTRFTATGLPPGVVLNATTGQLTGRPTKAGLYTVKITASNSIGAGPPLTVSWVVEDFPLPARGPWNGLVQREAGLNGDLGGRLTFTVAATGTYTAKMNLGAKTWSWSGRVDALPGNATSVTPFSIPRPKMTPLTGVLTLNLVSGELTGSVTDGQTTASLGAWRCPWSALNKPTAYVAGYTAALLRPALADGDARYPQGDGYATLNVTTTGTATWAGRLADGTLLTGSTALGPEGQVSHHQMLYVNTGSVQGWSAITAGTGLMDGGLEWYKAQQADKSTTRSYKAGIPLHTLNLLGARYLKPDAKLGQIALGLPAPGAPPANQNGRLTFSGAPLATNLELLFEINTKNVVKLPPAAQNPQAVRLTLVAPTGLLSGGFTFKDPDPLDVLPPIATLTRTATWNGVLITRPGLQQGRGHFNLAELPDAVGEKVTTTPIVSGRVVLDGAP